LPCSGCAASLTRLAAEAAKSSQDTTFSQYAAAVLNSLVYLLKDSLERLQDIHNIEASMADEAAWKALPPRWPANSCLLCMSLTDLQVPKIVSPVICIWILHWCVQHFTLLLHMRVGILAFELRAAWHACWHHCFVSLNIAVSFNIVAAIKGQVGAFKTALHYSAENLECISGVVDV